MYYVSFIDDLLRNKLVYFVQKESNVFYKFEEF
jgi:hypothetical protein